MDSSSSFAGAAADRLSLLGRLGLVEEVFSFSFAFGRSTWFLPLITLPWHVVECAVPLAATLHDGRSALGESVQARVLLFEVTPEKAARRQRAPPRRLSGCGL